MRQRNAASPSRWKHTPSLVHNADVALKTMEATDHPNIRINFDTGNISFYTDGTDAVTELKEIAQYVVSTHLKDHSGNFDEWDFPTLGTGSVDFAGVREVPYRHRFSGTMDYAGSGRSESSCPTSPQPRVWSVKPVLTQRCKDARKNLYYFRSYAVEHSKSCAGLNRTPSNSPLT